MNPPSLLQGPRQCLRALVVVLITELVFTSLSPAGQLLNISTRSFVGAEDRVLIGGFILRGAATKRVLLRGIGPSLSGAGVSEPLTDPTLELRGQNGELIYVNNNWGDTQQTEIQATGLAPKDGREAAIVADLAAPGMYSAILRGAGSSTGIGLVEIYDLTPNGGSVLVNISTRGFVQPGDRNMIAGFIVGGESMGRLVGRGIGPSLSSAGITESVADPVLSLLSGGRFLYANDDWKTSVQSELIQQSGIPPANDRESAIVADLGTGQYTFVLRGGATGTGTGTGLVEVYHLEDRANPAQ